MTTKLIRYILYSIAIVFIASISDLNATRVSGEVSGEWTREGHPYDVMENIVLRAGQTLTIDAGVQVLFQSGTNFIVYGTLVANGAARDSIIFRANNRQVGDWRWLKFEGPAANRSVLNYCVITHTERGLHMLNASPTISNSRISNHETTCVRIERSQGKLLNSDISNSQRTSIIITDNSYPTVRNCRIVNSPDNGIAIASNSGGIISGNTIIGAGDNGIFLSSASECSLSHNFIDNSGLQGIYASQSAVTQIFRNVITRSRGNYAIHYWRSNGGVAINNTIIGNSGTGLAIISSSVEVYNNIIIQSGRDGIFAQDSNPNLSSNCVWGNARDDYAGLERGNSDISQNPELDQNYFPAEGSPVIDRGDNRFRDPDGTRADIGAKFFNQNHAPEIQSFWPEDPDTIEGDQEVEFGVDAVDPDGDNLTYIWYINGEISGNESVMSHTFTRDGEYVVFVLIDDGLYEGRTAVDWNFSVSGSAVDFSDDAMPESFHLSAPYPNPFNSRSQFSLSVQTTGTARVSVLDLQGRTLVDLYNGIMQPGRHRFTISSAGLTTGTYFIMAELNGHSGLNKLVVLK